MQRIPLDRTPELLRPGLTVYAAGCAGQPDGVIGAWRNAPGCAEGVSFTGVYIPGVNGVDYSELGPGARMRTFFLAPEFRRGFAAGRIEFLPLHYTRIYPYLRDAAGVGLAVFQVSPPDADGTVTLGVSCDFTPALLEAGVPTLAVVNPNMPRTSGGPVLPLDGFTWVTEADTPLAGLETGDVPDDIAGVGSVIANLVNDGDTIQLGLGKVQAAVLRALEGRTGLGIHAGMISDPVLPLLEDGALERVTTNVALGGPELYAACATDPRIRFTSVAHTHDFDVLRRIPKLVSVNSVIEIDLFGQGNAEMMGGRQVSGHGGLVDFLRGARYAPGGRSILATAATAKDGTISRIVPRLDPATVTTTLRADADLVVTEYGVADLRHGDVDARAAALISVAAPQFRDDLSRAWREARQSM
ncbi:MAG TPA: acetyl-CoA hydrolase/transferase C-terminal domain-containing protein [Azospirillaceae bacterium]|nr:acetyl-CoA hydrolase/transferase C-terminal domain-containing protein [Azospirillaceae bacterium]